MDGSKSNRALALEQFDMHAKRRFRPPSISVVN